MDAWEMTAWEPSQGPRCGPGEMHTWVEEMHTQANAHAGSRAAHKTPKDKLGLEARSPGSLGQGAGTALAAVFWGDPVPPPLHHVPSIVCACSMGLGPGLRGEKLLALVVSWERGIYLKL